MHVLTTPAEMLAWSRARRGEGMRIGFVPTMGALHRGHVSLVDIARRSADVVVVSLFVNPLQFDRRDDFDRYPRPIDADIAACREAGVDAVYAPTAAAMYPDGFETTVAPGDLAREWEGAHRPGHFAGMATVVLKLLAAVSPDVAVFGQKDAQQLAIVRRMVVDFDLGIEIIAGPTVREADGLALSSRNERLHPAQRSAAACIAKGLHLASEAFASGMREVEQLVRIARSPVESTPEARLEYLDAVDPATFVRRSGALDDDGALLVAAVWFGEVRLIDNLALTPSPHR